MVVRKVFFFIFEKKHPKNTEKKHPIKTPRKNKKTPIKKHPKNAIKKTPIFEIDEKNTQSYT